jgi:D-serine deaminase-like pyridoxal phosphate-dependent protein
MYVVPPLPESYRIKPGDIEQIITPALVIYPAVVESNIQATLKLTGGDPNRWRPHLKTAKIPAVIRMLVAAGVRNVKCSTTLELLVACEEGASDVLLAFSVTGANARRTVQIAKSHPQTRVSVLVETAEQLDGWKGEEIGIFLDINSGMNRTGMRQDQTGAIIALAKLAGSQFRGLHYYDGHMSGVSAAEREAKAHEGYRWLSSLAESVTIAGLRVEEIITSGTPAAPYALSFPGFAGASSFIHRISPGTVVYNDMTSLEQLPGLGYAPAALVLSSVVSHPTVSAITCDAGHKSVSADAGVPTCTVLGPESFTPLKPSEEHLPINCGSAGECPAIGSKLYLLPRHVCPTVNNFDQAIFVREGRIVGVEAIAARGHETLLVQNALSPSTWALR